jgi:dihydrodipicolinate synthase/N-acetylneuraminate lyase
MALPRGIIPVLQTPFGEDGGIDYDSLGRLIDDAVEGGAVGFLSPAVASEVGTLTGDERDALCRFVHARIGGRAALIAGCSSVDADECARLARGAEAAGADAFLVAAPETLLADDEGLVRFMRQAAGDVRLPLIVQDLDWTGGGVAMATLLRLRDEIPQLAGIKIETVPAGPKYTLAREAFGAVFHISGGWATPQMIEAMDRGVDGLIPEASMVRVYDAIWRLHETGRRREAVELFRTFVPILTFSNQEIHLSIAMFKRLLVRKGIFAGAGMRAGGFEWDECNLRIADELIEYYLELEADVKGTGGDGAGGGGRTHMPVKGAGF